MAVHFEGPKIIANKKSFILVKFFSISQDTL